MKTSTKFIQTLITASALINLTNPHALGQESYSISLEQAQKIGLEKAFAVQYADLDKQKSERDVKELLATGLPQVSIVADYSQYSLSTT